MNTSNLVHSSESRIQGVGLFATEDIPPGVRIIEYVGERIHSQEMLRRCAEGNSFIFAAEDGAYVDGAMEYNLARLINHSCDPNSEILSEDGCIWIVALRNIVAGDEITFNYSYDLEEYRNHPCNCGSAECVGYIVAEEFFDHVRRQNLFDIEPAPARAASN